MIKMPPSKKNEQQKKVEDFISKGMKKAKAPEDEKQVPISITMPRELVEKVDALAKENYFTRSAFVKAALNKFIKELEASH